jgi:hypothetical protein
MSTRRFNFVKNGVVLPVILAVTKKTSDGKPISGKGDLLIIPLDEVVGSKAIMQERLPLVIKKIADLQCERYALVTQAENLLVQCEDRQGNNYTLTAEIIRAGAVASLGKEEEVINKTGINLINGMFGDENIPPLTK